MEVSFQQQLADAPWLLGLLEVLWIAFIFVYVVLQKRPPVATLAWLLLLASLPVVGLPIYAVFGPRRLERKRLRHALARESVGVTEAARRVREAATRLLLRAAQRQPGMDLATLAVSCGEAAPLPCETRLHTEGRDAHRALLEAVSLAQHHIHLEYYIFEAGAFGRQLRDALVARAGAGVEVRLLLDAVGSRPLRSLFLAPLISAGAEVAWFNPVSFALFRPWFVNFRTHRKIVVVDGSIGFTGGMNVSDDHDQAVHGDAASRDTHLRIEGDAVAPLALVFLEDWAFATGRLVTGESYISAPTGRGSELLQIVASGPDDDTFAIHKQMFAAIASARDRVWLTTPYFVPDESMTTALASAAMRGVDVRLLVPQRGDHAIVDAASRSYFRELLQVGVRVWHYTPRFIHSKTLVVDWSIGQVGTANFDNRSFRLNFEVVATFFSPGPIKQLAQHFQCDLQTARELTISAEAATPPLRRLAEGAARLFSPLL